MTGADGTFSLAGIPVGLVTLRIRATGYEPLEFLVQSSPFHPPEVDGQSVLVQIPLVRITTPRALVEDEILLVQQAMTDQSVVGPYRVAVLDPPGPDVRIDEIASWRSRLGDDARMGLFTPWLRVPVTAGLLDCPPSGHVCGAFALAENTVGIHRTGANLPLRYVEGTTQPIDDGEQAYLNPAGINAIRAFPGRGVRVFGSRTLSSATQWRFLTARRVVDAIEQTLERALQWMIFEPNSQITRHAVALTAGALLGRMYRDGVLAGSSPEAAFSVKCDLQNNPDESRATGQLVVDIGVAPTLPYEFVLFRLGHAYDALSVTESAR